ncbi:MAG: class I SAM-dependent methyltransferase [Solirubrobacteraceae bacterium]|nr:class I SAM-dependent methyltransferase [Solirubrobacteraceae bacterium]
MLDWSDGDYAITAAALAPATERVLDVAGVTAGDRLLDVACGTGNAALAAVRRGATATGVDAAIGLLELARGRASLEGVDAEFLGGDFHALPVAEATFDVAVSVFGVIFAGDPAAAIGEMLRATRPDGVIAFSSWLNGGAVDAAGGILRDAINEHLPVPESSVRPGHWQDEEWIHALLAEQGAREITLAHDEIQFTAVSPEAWFADQEEHHPVWRFGARTLFDSVWDDVRRRSLDVLHEHNEDPEAFRGTSRYVIARALR